MLLKAFSLLGKNGNRLPLDFHDISCRTFNRIRALPRMAGCEFREAHAELDGSGFYVFEIRARDAPIVAYRVLLKLPKFDVTIV